MHKRTGDRSLAEGWLPERFGRNPRLERIDALIDWERLAQIVSEVHAARSGRPAYPPLAMLKIMLLQQWHGLSDPAMEEALYCNLAYLRFAGLSLGESVPDHSTISRFRSQLVRRGLAEPLFAEISRQLDALGVTVKRGTLIDASFVDAAARPPRAGRPAADPDAKWGRKGGETHFGYKANIGVDQGSGLVRKAALTAANVNDTVPADELLSGDEAAVYADKAYDTKARRERLRCSGIKDRIMHRPNKHRTDLPYWQERRNALIAPLRAPVERVFGTLKRGYGYRRVRYMGFAPNALELLFKCMAYNLRRAAVLLAGAAPVRGSSAS